MSITAVTSRLPISEGNYEAGQIDAAVAIVRTDVEAIMAEMNLRLDRLEEVAAEFKAIVEVDIDTLSAAECARIARSVGPTRDAFVTAYNKLAELRISDNTAAEVGNVWVKTDYLSRMLKERTHALRDWEQQEVSRVVREQEAREDAAFAEDLRERVKHGEYIDVDDEIVKRRRRRKDGFAIPAYAYKYVTPPTAQDAEGTAI